MESTSVYARIQRTVLEIREEMDRFDQFKNVYTKVMKTLQTLSSQCEESASAVKTKTSYLKMLLDMEKNINGDTEIKDEPTDNMELEESPEQKVFAGLLNM